MSPHCYDDMIAGVGFNTASLPNRTLDEALRIGADMGLRCVELLAFAGYRHTAGELAGLFFDALSATERKRLASQVARFDRVGVHAPFWDVAFFAPNPATRAASRAQLLTTLSVAGELGAETVTTHVIPRLGRELPEFREDVLDFYREAGDTAREAGVTLTIETGYPRGIEEFASLVREIDHPAVGANVDVGHLRGLLTEEQREPSAIAGAYNSLLEQHLKSLGDRIYHMHLHDTQAEGLRDHRECGTGIIDYEAIFDSLLKLNYRGMMTFELEEPRAEESLRRSYRVIVEAIRAAGGG